MGEGGRPPTVAVLATLGGQAPSQEGTVVLMHQGLDHGGGRDGASLVQLRDDVVDVFVPFARVMDVILL